MAGCLVPPARSHTASFLDRGCSPERGCEGRACDAPQDSAVLASPSGENLSFEPCRRRPAARFCGKVHKRTAQDERLLLHAHSQTQRPALPHLLTTQEPKADTRSPADLPDPPLSPATRTPALQRVLRAFIL